MNFRETLQRRNLKKDELSRPIRLLIDKYEKLEEKAKQFGDYDNLADDEKWELTSLEEQMETLSEEIAQKIVKFNPEIQKKRLEVIRLMEQKKLEKKSEQKQEPKPTKKTIEPKAEEVEKVVKVDTQKFEVPQTKVEVEEEEFVKIKETKPRNMSKGLILMGVGAFLLTWGAVNFFKDRR